MAGGSVLQVGLARRQWNEYKPPEFSKPYYSNPDYSGAEDSVSADPAGLYLTFFHLSVMYVVVAVFALGLASLAVFLTWKVIKVTLLHPCQPSSRITGHVSGRGGASEGFHSMNVVTTPPPSQPPVPTEEGPPPAYVPPPSYEELGLERKPGTGTYFEDRENWKQVSNNVARCDFTETPTNFPEGTVPSPTRQLILGGRATWISF